MAHELTRLRSKLFNTPLLVDMTTFESVMDYLDKRCEGDVVVQKESAEEFSMYSTLYYAENNLGVIHIDGPLTNKSTGWEALCGGTSYESIKEDFEALLEEGAKTIAFMVSSGGGEAYNMMATGNYLRKLADENGVRIISYVDSLSASAAYGLTAISDEIITHPESEIGSIGVLIRLINDSKALEMKGYERTFITAGDEKIPFADDGSFREGFIADLKSKVDTLYEEFTGYVAHYRNIPVEAVRDTQAKTFLAKDAISLGLADKAMTQEEFYAYLSGKAQANSSGDSMNNRIFKFTKNEEKVDMTQLAELQAQLEAAHSELASAQAAVIELASVKEQLQTIEAAFAAKETELTAALEQIKAMEVEKEQAKKNARKEKLASVVAADQLEAVAASLEALDEEAFKTVLNGFSAQKKAIEESELMKEVGGEGAEAAATAEEDAARAATEASIKQKLGLL